MSKNVKILALVFLVCANISLLAYIGLRKSAASDSPVAQREIDRLPPSNSLTTAAAAYNPAGCYSFNS